MSLISNFKDLGKDTKNDGELKQREARLNDKLVK